MNITDLADADATAHLLRSLGTDVDLDDAHALAEEALDFDDPPPGAWTVLAHVAEHRGDNAGFERWTAAALDVDPDWLPSCEDDDYLAILREPAPRKATAAIRADHLLRKIDHFSGRGPQLRAQLDLAGAVLGIDVPRPTPAALDVADSWQFAGFLAFEARLLRAFESRCADLLPPAERALLESWHDVRHRHVRMAEQSRRRWKLVDVATGEVIVASTLIEDWWAPGREAFVVVAPVGSKQVVVGEPILFGPEHFGVARAAVARLDDDPLAVARAALGWMVDRDRAQRATFVFPELEPDDVPSDELAIYDLVRARHPALVERADAGDVLAEADLLLEAIIAERIITRRVIRTWDMAKGLLTLGMSRSWVMEQLRDATYAELWERTQERAA